MSNDEIDYLMENYNSKYLTIHEEFFQNRNRWKNVKENLSLEMDYNDNVAKQVKVEEIGGFCIDVAHFQSAKDRKTTEYEYVLEKKEKNIFKCNHLNGYNKRKKKDVHTIKKLKQFDYLKNIPHLF